MKRCVYVMLHKCTQLTCIAVGILKFVTRNTSIYAQSICIITERALTVTTGQSAVFSIC